MQKNFGGGPSPEKSLKFSFFGKRLAKILENFLKDKVQKRPAGGPPKGRGVHRKIPKVLLFRKKVGEDFGELFERQRSKTAGRPPGARQKFFCTLRYPIHRVNNSL